LFERRSRRYVESRCITALAATSSGESSVVDQMLEEMRSIAGAERVHLLQRDGKLRRGSAAKPGTEEDTSELLENPRFVARALQTLLPFGSEDLNDAAAKPFIVVPVEANGRSQGSAIFEWLREGSGPMTRRPCCSRSPSSWLSSWNVLRAAAWSAIVER
jgi:hypothetical protein